jgi:hypothetical protein
VKIEAGRADVNAMMVKVARQMAEDRAEARRKLASGQVAYDYKTRDQIAVMQTPAPAREFDPLREPRTRWTTMGSLPFGLEPLTVEGCPGEAAANGWDLRTLLTRRLHRAYRNALTAGKILKIAEAAARAKQAEIYVASMGISEP